MYPILYPVAVLHYLYQIRLVQTLATFSLSILDSLEHGVEYSLLPVYPPSLIKRNPHLKTPT